MLRRITIIETQAHSLSVFGCPRLVWLAVSGLYDNVGSER